MLVAIRHGEKPNDPSDPGLTTDDIFRVVELRKLLLFPTADRRF